MKKLLLVSGIAFSLCAAFHNNAHAQVRLNLSFGVPVMQQPWYGYDDDYYYMPDQGVYYNVARGVYVYPEDGRWMYAGNLPPRYGGYSWNSGRYYRIRGRAPFERDGYYRRQYVQDYDRRDYRGGAPRQWNGNGYNGERNGWSRGGGYQQHPDYRNNGYQGHRGYRDGGHGDRR